MKIALLADIHGNAFALEAVLDEIRREQISTLLICGDFVGYYYSPKKILDLIKTFNVVACRGNHEDLFKEWLAGSQNVKTQLTTKYGSGFQKAENSLTEEQITWLNSLEHPVYCSFNEKKLLISHGCPWDLNLYLYENIIDNYVANFKALSEICDVVVVGHSHYQFIKKIEELIVINPGSVGQPRSGTFKETNNTSARAQWAILDTNNMKIDFKTTIYDASLLFEEIDINDPSSNYLKKVLLRRE